MNFELLLKYYIAFTIVGGITLLAMIANIVFDRFMQMKNETSLNDGPEAQGIEDSDLTSKDSKEAIEEGDGDGDAPTVSPPQNTPIEKEEDAFIYPSLFEQESNLDTSSLPSLETDKIKDIIDDSSRSEPNQSGDALEDDWIDTLKSLDIDTSNRSFNFFKRSNAQRPPKLNMDSPKVSDTSQAPRNPNEPR